jgi:hypothetical protein
MNREIQEVLRKLPESDRKLVITYMENHENRVCQLEQNLIALGDILQVVLEQIQSIQASINVMIRTLRPVLRPRSDRKVSPGDEQ